jgi:3-isopropylmalate/(R)-2-methylmalate dehydratase small subunit
MEPVKRFHSRTVVIPSSNIDTDQIIPARFLTTTHKEGLGAQLFADWRYAPDGAPKPDFVLNRPESRGCRVLVAGRNFGCGSSREHAAWALSDYGFRCVIAPSFADIFHSNAGKNGILLVTLPEEQVQTLLDRAAKTENYELTVSLEKNTIRDGQGFEAKFAIDPFRRDCLLEGLDDIGLTLRHADALDQFEKKHDAAFWVAPTTPENVNA